MKSFKAAVCQNLPLRDTAKSVEDAIAMIRRAAADGARLVSLPEMFFRPYELSSIAEHAEEDGSTIGRLRETARDLRIYLCTGSIAERENGRVFNRARLIGPDGEVLLIHDKVHMFDVDLPGLTVRESAVFTRGDRFDVADTELGSIGILICYDIRFPESFRELTRRGAEVIIVPAAFNDITGPAHWHITLRARAVENQCFVIAASPSRDTGLSYKAYGHSLIVDPWGTVLCEAGEDRTIVSADIDAERLRDVRARLPLLKEIGFLQ